MKHSNMEAALRHGSTHCASLPEKGNPAAFLPRKHRRAAQPLLAAAMAGLLALTGCTAGDDPPETTASPASASTSPAPGATTAATAKTTAAPIYKPATDLGPAQNVPVPVLPEKAKEFSEEGLIAFTEYWYQTLGYAFETGDPAPMMAISDAACKTCGAMEEAVMGGHEGGKWIKGGKMVIDPPRSAFVKMDDGTYQALTMARQEQVLFFNADKTIRRDFGVTIAERDILVATYADSKWTALTVEHVAGSKSS
ncbi:DUF6318 family protein [Specibacter sp. NPDC057265]|uniref:DUF6318 family protein n=1 Tax=Specibacter sp. NPDC057265 TaxID=3346075 RepID=UPI003631DF73